MFISSTESHKHLGIYNILEVNQINTRSNAEMIENVEKVILKLLQIREF